MRAGCRCSFARPVVFVEYDRSSPRAWTTTSSRFFPWLRSLGYERLSVFTNAGEWRCALTTADRAELDQLTREITPQDRSWFADVCAWHADDHPLADEADHLGGGRH